MIFCRTPSGLEDVSKYPALFVSLLATGSWSVDDLKKVAGLNFLRVFREVENVSQIHSMLLNCYHAVFRTDFRTAVSLRLWKIHLVELPREPRPN